MSSNDPLFTTGATDGTSEATVLPHLVFTVPGIKLNISTLIVSNWDLGQDGVVLVSLAALLGLVNCSMVSVVLQPKLISIGYLGFRPSLPLPAGGTFEKHRHLFSMCHLFLYYFCKFLIFPLQTGHQISLVGLLCRLLLRLTHSAAICAHIA